MADASLVVAGQAGQGVDTAAELLARAFARGGYHVFAYPDVMSRIRGGSNFTSVRVSEHRVHAGVPGVSLLLMLDRRAAEEHLKRLVPGGTAIADGAEPGGSTDGRIIAVPMTKTATEKAGSATMANVVGLGAVMAATGHQLGGLSELIRERFRAKGRDVVNRNLECARAGFEHVKALPGLQCDCRLPATRSREAGLLMTGNQAVGLAALASGLRFYAGYPMSPSTPIMEFLARRQDAFPLVVEQVEDELAALTTALGASYAGARAMTATSGGGFSLMVEALGLAGMAELPVVVVVCQRPGPATGFPTRTEQADLLFVLHASQDEFPRFVFAPGTPEQAFHCTVRAFDLADRFRVPAIVLSDQLLSDSYWTVPAIRPEEPATGGAARPVPGRARQPIRSLGSEHDEEGRQTEDAAVRVRMHERRMARLREMAGELDEVASYPSEDDECQLVCFGSTYGAAREAVDLLRAERCPVGMVHLPELSPFPRDRVMARLARAKRVITVELNSTGQLARLLCRETRLRPDAEVLKYDGRPFTGPELADRVRVLL